MNLDTVSVRAPLCQLTEAKLVTGRPVAKQKGWCRWEARAGFLLALLWTPESTRVLQTQVLPPHRGVCCNGASKAISPVLV